MMSNNLDSENTNSLDSENTNSLDNKNNKYILILTHVITFISGGISMHIYMHL